MNKVLHRKLLTFTHNAIIWFRIVFRNGKSTVVITRLKKNHLIVSQKICSISCYMWSQSCADWGLENSEDLYYVPETSCKTRDNQSDSRFLHDVRLVSSSKPANANEVHKFEKLIG